MALLINVLKSTALMIGFMLIPIFSFGQYTTTSCQTVNDALIGPDRNDWSHANLPIVNEGYLHNFDPPILPCGINNPSLTSLVVNIELLTITTTPECTGIPIFGNVLLNCPLTLTSICPIVQDVLSPGCTFGTGATLPGLYSLDIFTCGVMPLSTDTIGVDIIPATDFSPSCPSDGMAITNGIVTITYEICIDFTYDQDVPLDCANTITQSCDDGDPCTENDEESVDECDNSIVCIPCAGTPVPSCISTTILPCDDLDPCTENDEETVESCDNSIVCIPCAGMPVPSCTSTTVLPCDDSDPCTENDEETVDACDNSIVCAPCAGTPVPSCTSTTVLPCDDSDPCTENDEETVESCDNSIVCVPCAGTPVPSCTSTTVLPCDDSDPCTENDEETVESCDNSIVCVPCAGTPVPSCTSTTVLPCDDSDPCTENDEETVESCDNSIVCVPCAGTPIPSCTSTTVLPCDDLDPCTENDQEIVESCDNSIICVPCFGTPVPSCASTTVLPCDDLDPCTENDQQIVESCDNSIVCVPCFGTPVSSCNSTTVLPCDDSNPCTESDEETVDACDNSIVCIPCVGTPIPSCTSTTVLPCDDSDPCTENDEETVEFCDNSIVCIPCVGTPIPSCTSTTVLPCDDLDPCTENDEETVESCDNSIVCIPCVGTPIPSCTSTTVLPCDDSDPCTENDEETVESCDNSIVCIPCVGTPIPSCTSTTVLPCDDSDPCTENDEETVESCDNSIVCIPCVGTPVPSCTSTTVLPCDDLDPCTENDEETVESCDNSIVCIPCAGTLVVPLPCDDGDCTNGEEVWDTNTCSCTIIPPIFGCTNPTANNFDPTATCDDGSCSFDCPDPGDCDDGICINGEEIWDGNICECISVNIPVPCTDDGDCTNGEEVWDANTCNCNIIPPIFGCTDPTANNFDPTATCDDGSCSFDCPDPGNCDDGICINGEEIWDANICECISVNIPVPCTDDGDCTNGEEVWDANTCNCNIISPVFGCTNPTANNFDPTATCDDGSCSFDCPDPGDCDDGNCANGEEVWDGDICECISINIPVPCTDDGDCSNGEEVWDTNTCSCTIIPPIFGCTDPTANNFDPTATCDDGSCSFDCPDPGNCDDGDCTNGEEFWDDILCACQPGIPPIDPGCDDGDCTNGEEFWDGCDCQPGIPVDCNNGVTLTIPCNDGDSNTFNDQQTILDCDGTICIPCMGTPCNVQAFIQGPINPLTCQSLENGVLLEGTGSSSGTNISYEWFFNNTIIGTEISLEVFEEGVYTLWVIDNLSGCTSSNEMELIIPIVVLDAITEVNNESCPGEANGSILIDTVFGGQAPYLFALDPDNYTTNNQFANLSPGNYTLFILDSDGCESQIDIIIQAANPLIIDLGEDRRITLGESIQISAYTNVTVDTIIWDFDASLNCLDCLDPFASPIDQTIYSISIIDINGCMLSDQITIFVDKVQRVFIPNTFTPNHDGLNDYFMIFGGSDVKIVRSIKIYNRWGGNLFSATDFPPNELQFAWDGTFRGEELNPGVYLYFAEIEFIDGRKEIMAGEITLLK